MPDALPDALPSVRAEVAAVAPRYRLALGSARYRGRAGVRRGHGVGSSLEFHDFRDYAPGDDLRHVDWRGYARSEQLRVRLHQEEVAPHVVVVLDGSASMAATATKGRAARVLCAALRHWAQREGAATRLGVLGVAGFVDDVEAVVFAGDPGPAPPGVPLRPGGVRVLVSDGLWLADPLPLVRALQHGASRFVCLQLLDPWELAPEPGGATALVDAESSHRAELQLDARAIAAYRERLERLVGALRAPIVHGGGVFVQVAAAGLDAMAARALVPAAVLEPA